MDFFGREGGGSACGRKPRGAIVVRMQPFVQYRPAKGAGLEMAADEYNDLIRLTTSNTVVII